MKFYKTILKYFISVWILIGISLCGGLDINLELLNTSQFNLINWEDIDDLWYVEVNNTSPDGIDYILEFTLNKGSDELVLGRTKLLFIAADDSITYKNLDPEVWQEYTSLKIESEGLRYD